MIKKALADFFFFLEMTFFSSFFFSFPKRNRNISLLFTAQLIAVGFYLKRSVRPPGRRHWSSYSVIMRLSGCVMLEGGFVRGNHRAIIQPTPWVLAGSLTCSASHKCLPWSVTIFNCSRGASYNWSSHQSRSSVLPQRSLGKSIKFSSPPLTASRRGVSGFVQGHRTCLLLQRQRGALAESMQAQCAKGEERVPCGGTSKHSESESPGLTDLIKCQNSSNNNK